MTIAMRGGEQISSDVQSTETGELEQGNQGNAGEKAGGEAADAAVPAELVDGLEPDFPHQELKKLDEMISRPRWVIPVLPGGELEILLEASIDLCKRGLDTRSEACQRFFRDGLTISFTKILTDEAVSGWKHEIHRSIMKNCERLIELCVVKLCQDWFPLLDLLAMALNPNNKFHMYNSARPSETVPPGSVIPDDELSSRPPDPRTPRGWLVDLINRFGVLGGFQLLLDRLQHGENLSVVLIYALLRPFGLCFDLLTIHTLQKYFLPILEIVPVYLDNLSDDELKKEAKNETKNDALSSIIKYLKSIASKLPNQGELAKNLEMFRLKMILRLLQISSFNGKMNALNEVNKVIANVAAYPHRHTEMEEWLTPDRMADWIKENKVLQIVLRDSLHQPQYVEKLEKIVRFVIREKALTMEDLDNIWAAQVGKHEVIVKNVHDLLAKLAWDFTPDQLDHLFTCFQVSWSGANRKQREKLLELIRRLAEDDKEGVMAHKVLTLLWSLAHSTDTPTEIMDQALTAHIKILDYSCSQDRDTQKMQWLERCVEELRDDKWVLPALKHIREICCLYKEAPQNLAHSGHVQRSPHSLYRHELVNRLQQQRTLVISVTENLTDYIEKIRRIAKDNPIIDPNTIYPDGRYNHVMQVQERLNFLRFLLKDGQLWLCSTQAKQIWHCLAENAVFLCDREACFWWFSKLMGEEPDLDPDINRLFFEENILQLDPTLMTESGIKCFDRFFKAVNSKERKLSAKRHAYLMEDFELIGMDYIWRVILCAGEDIANRAIELLKETYTNLGPKLQANQMAIHEDFITGCVDRLKAAHDTISCMDKDKDSLNKFNEELKRMCRVLKVLYEYVSECDNEFGEDRHILPLLRAYRGRHMMLVIRFNNQGRQVDDLEVWVHTNETLGNLRRQVLHRLKLTPGSIGQVTGQHGAAAVPAMKLDLFLNGDILETSEDRKLIGSLPFRDKTILTGKLCQLGSNMPSSPESSSDSSAGSPQHPNAASPSSEMENFLPGVLMCNQPKWMEFLLSLADMGCALNCPRLRDMARNLLQLLPPDSATMDKLTLITTHRAAPEPSGPTLDSLFLSPSPSTVLYYLQVTYVMLMPATNPIIEKSFEFQQNFIKSRGVPVVISMITKNNFLSKADIETKRSAYIVVLRLLKLLLTVVAHAVLQDNAQSPCTSDAVNLRDALANIPHPTADVMIRNVAVRLVQHFSPQVIDSLKEHTPDLSWIRVVIKMTWAAASGHMDLYQSSDDELHKAIIDAQPGDTPHAEDDFYVCKEALETMTVALMLKPRALETLFRTSAENSWQHFIIDLLLISPVRCIRSAAAEQFLLMATKCCSGHTVMVSFVGLLFSMLNTTVKEHASQSTEYFQLLCRLLNFACSAGWTIPGAETLLNNEIAWLKKVKDTVKQTGDTGMEEALLEGHLGVTRELVATLSSEKKFHIGADDTKGINLIRELVEDFVFPASRMMLALSRSGDVPVDQIIPVCSTPSTVHAALDLLVAISTGCVPNLRLLANMLIDMYFSDDVKPVVEWEYVPPVGPRPPRGFVGLKNAGATCYMNSVLQQLYMIEPIRIGILTAEGAATNLDEDFSGEERFDNEVGLEVGSGDGEEDKCKGSGEESRREYNIGILKHVQAIFGHLAYGRLQYYVPRGLWKHFKILNEPVNLREQHDALEFYNSLVDSVDEALKALNCDQVMAKVLGGTFADQKICRGCPHRYSREEPFMVLNIDIRNQNNLLDSLEQYVKGDLLEGANAYHCDKCNRKVDTVKRMCLKKLPSIMAIQLKRFDYDWERECAIKFNDYFEFPRDLNMEPYTVSGLAKLEGEVLQEELEGESNPSCKYNLTGIVVHSGQASGGHYYSYILHRYPDGSAKWYKFDDGEVSEWKMEDEEEMRNQCFGGEYVGEVFDHISKRVNCRRQKRWWNAYILFYTRNDVGDNLLAKAIEDLSLSDTKHNAIKMPIAIERSVRKMNVRFLHNRNQYSPEFFQFMRKLLSCNAAHLIHSDKISTEGEELALISIKLASRFLFNSGFHTKKSLRGSANDWYEAICIHLRASKNIRIWFAVDVLFAHSHRFCEYILECPTSEVRSTFVKIIVLLCHYALLDGTGPVQLPPMLSQYLEAGSSLSDQLLIAVLALLKKEVAEHGRHLTQYFSLFLMYASVGVKEKAQLLKLNIPEIFMQVALDEGPGPPIKYQYADLGKLYQVVSLLVRCMDVSSKEQCSQPNQVPAKNPYGEPGEYIMPIQPAVAEILFDKVSYVKKMIEDGATSEETVKLVKFCSWECAGFSSSVLSELLWQIAFSYTYELRPYLDLLLHLLLMEDSWQNHRIHNALKGIPNDREGLFDTIQRSKNHYQRRAYQCIKCMVHLFNTCPAAHHMLQSNGDLKRKWSSAVDWLGEELERRPYSANHQFGYSNWSPPAQSNESTNGYFLERSPSAKLTYEKAYELCPDEVNEVEKPQPDPIPPPFQPAWDDDVDGGRGVQPHPPNPDLQVTTVEDDAGSVNCNVDDLENQEPEGDDLSEEGESPQPEEKVPFRPTRTNSSGPQSLGGRTAADGDTQDRLQHRDSI